MKNLCTILFLFVALAVRATDVSFDFKNLAGGADYFRLSTSTNRLKITPLDGAIISEPSIMAVDPTYYLPSTNGTGTMSNLYAGRYLASIRVKEKETSFQFIVTNSASTIPLWSLASVPTNSNPALGSSYSISTQNAMFVAKNGTPTNGQVLTYNAGLSGFWPSNSAGGSGGNFMQILTNSPTLYVSTNGNDNTAVRGRIDLPYRTPLAAYNAAAPEDLVWFHPGQYDLGTNGGLRRNVHSYFSPRASLTWSNGNMSADAYCMFDDRQTGPTTNYIMGYGRFLASAYRTSTDDANFNLRGAFSVTNHDSLVIVKGVRTEVEAPTQGAAQGYFGGLNVFDGTVYFDMSEGVFPLPDRDEDHFNVSFGIYWQLGDIHVNSPKVISRENYAMWGHDPSAGTSQANFWHNGDEILSTNGVGFYVDGTPGVDSPNYRSWLTVKEIKGGQIGFSTIGQSRVYLTSQKVSSPAGTSVDSSAVVWADIQKISGTNVLISLRGGEGHFAVHHYEDLAADGVNGANKVLLLDGNNELIGGRYTAKNTNAIYFARVVGGTNLLKNMTVDTRRAGTTNAWPVYMDATNANALTIENSTLLVSGPTTNAIYSTNAQTVINNGTLVSSTNIHPLVTLSGGEFVNKGLNTVFANKFAGNLLATNATVSRALASGADGIVTNAATTQAELDFVSGVTAAIQTQFLAGTNNVAGLRTAFNTVSNNFLSVSNAHVALSNSVTTLTAAVNADSNSLTSVSNDVRNLKTLQQNFLPGANTTFTTNNTTNVTVASTISTNVLLHTNTLRAGNAIVLTNAGITAIDIAVAPGMFMTFGANKVLRYVINSGGAANFTGIGESATLATPGVAANVTTDATGPSRVIQTTFGSATSAASVSGNLNYRTGKLIESASWSGVTNIATAFTWWHQVTDQSAATVTGTNPNGNYAGVRYSSGTDSTYKFITKDNSTQTITDTLVAIGSGYHTFYFAEVIANSTWVCWIDGLPVATNTTHLPTSSTSLRYVLSCTTDTSATNALATAWVMNASKN